MDPYVRVLEREINSSGYLRSDIRSRAGAYGEVLESKV